VIRLQSSTSRAPRKRRTFSPKYLPRRSTLQLSRFSTSRVHPYWKSALENDGIGMKCVLRLEFWNSGNCVCLEVRVEFRKFCFVLTSWNSGDSVSLHVFLAWNFVCLEFLFLKLELTQRHLQPETLGIHPLSLRQKEKVSMFEFSSLYICTPYLV
jgi:hypothetical protein